MRTPAQLLRRAGWSLRARWRFALVAALVAALAVCGGRAYVIHRETTPSVQATLHVGDAVVVQGVRYRVDRFDVVPQLPNQEHGQPPVKPPRHASLVVVVLTVQAVDPQVDMSSNGCDPELVNAVGVVWQRADEWGYDAKIPHQLTCTLPEPEDDGDPPWPHDKPFETAFTFAVPDGMQDGLHLRLSLSNWSGPHGLEDVVVIER